jgi:hypothetical protein
MTAQPCLLTAYSNVDRALVASGTLEHKACLAAGVADAGPAASTGCAQGVERITNEQPSRCYQRQEHMARLQESKPRSLTSICTANLSLP